ncbi:hypothetical protein MAJHIDBO_00218 [Propionibacterium freudenreichii subsp. shermanii]|nr:hypothetical protein MAJHIDBO_00218 [Propionibacterium freudenreichii subsp. shermanii]SPS07906.1 hypothetical protein MAJHIDBO_00218 [Propionibacterium freudenreichii subsp. shermanii]
MMLREIAPPKKDVHHDAGQQRICREALPARHELPGGDPTGPRRGRHHLAGHRSRRCRARVHGAQQAIRLEPTGGAPPAGPASRARHRARRPRGAGGRHGCRLRRGGGGLALYQGHRPAFPPRRRGHAAARRGLPHHLRNGPGPGDAARHRPDPSRCEAQQHPARRHPAARLGQGHRLCRRWHRRGMGRRRPLGRAGQHPGLSVARGDRRRSGDRPVRHVCPGRGALRVAVWRDPLRAAAARGHDAGHPHARSRPSARRGRRPVGSAVDAAEPRSAPAWQRGRPVVAAVGTAECAC